MQFGSFNKHYMDIKFNEPNYTSKKTQLQQSGITSFLLRYKLAKSPTQALIIQLCIIGAFAVVLMFNLFSRTPQKELTPQEAAQAGSPAEMRGR